MVGLEPMDALLAVIPGSTPDQVGGRLRDPEAAADWIPAFAGMTSSSICFRMTEYQAQWLVPSERVILL